ncbi:p-loop containing nucleoside triphosphate hydrolase protein [Mycena sanguinolenta]|uniref:p-loop containing nucleoside triphosphate hydrolase protein n=1 Tax=Mycena sanguinolenta TaxID=230812 RepID=A0A8H6XUL2_9AGAR|nr:p-loop containing nucleoside triphosphate hydrolase protein [Mycena sanguinolenta]
MALNLNYAANTYLAVTLPPSSSYLQAPASLALLHPAVAHVGQVGAMPDVQIVSIPKDEWELSEDKRAEILAAFRAVGKVDVQEPKQRAKRGGDEL